MSLSRIYTVLSAETDAAGLSAVACDLAGRFDSQIVGAYMAESPAPYAFFGGLSPSSPNLTVLAVDTYLKLNEDGLADAHAVFVKTCKQRGLGVSDDDRKARAFWAGTLAGPMEIGVVARLSDLIVLGQPQTGKPSDQMAAFDAALFRARRSVLVVNDGCRAMPLHHVGIAFDGSAEAARAVTCGLPLLRHADRISIVTVGAQRPGEPTPEELHEYLLGQGIDVNVSIAVNREGTVADTIIREIGERGIDLLILGGYSHTRLRETVLGGVTRNLLQRAGVPLLLAH